MESRVPRTPGRALWCLAGSCIVPPAPLLWVLFSLAPIASVQANGVIDLTPLADAFLSDQPPPENPEDRDPSLQRRGILRGDSRMLFRFDLGELPPRAVLTSARLILHERDFLRFATSRVLGLFRLTRDWDEATVSYTHRRSGSTWDEPGGSLDEETDWGHSRRGLISRVVSQRVTTPKLLEFDITALARQWHSGERANHGVCLLSLQSFGGAPVIDLRESRTIDARPVLRVAWCFDDDPPRLCDVLPADGAVGVSSETPLRWVLDDEGSGLDLDSVRAIVDGVDVSDLLIPLPVEEGLQFEHLCATALSAGSRVAELRIRDRAGNELTARTRFETGHDDISAPRLVYRFPPENSESVPTRALLTWVLEDPSSGVDADSVQLFLDGARALDGLSMSRRGDRLEVRYEDISGLPANARLDLRLEVCDRRGNCAAYASTIETAPRGRWFRGLLHMHDGRYSHDAEGGPEIPEMSALTRSRGHDFIAFNNHDDRRTLADTQQQVRDCARVDAMWSDFAVLPGMELTTSNAGHICVWGVDWDRTPMGTEESEFPNDLHQVAEWAFAQGGIAAFAHPDLHSALPVRELNFYEYLTTPIFFEAWNGVQDRLGRNGVQDAWQVSIAPLGGYFDQLLARGRSVRVFLGDDGHGAVNDNVNYIWCFDSRPRVETLLDGMRNGRMVLSPANQVRADLRVQGFPVGSHLETLSGVETEAVVDVEAHSSEGPLERVELVQNGRIVYERDGIGEASFTTRRRILLAAGERGYLRVNAWNGERRSMTNAITYAGASSFELSVAPVDRLPEPVTGFVRGDTNGDYELGISDQVALLRYLFAGVQPPRRFETCGDAYDSNDNGRITVDDALIVLNFLFGRGPPPLPPFPDRAQDPTADPLLDIDCRP